MTREEYIDLFHKEQLNLVAFKKLFHCDEEVLRLVNAALAQEREAILQMSSATWFKTQADYDAAIRSRGQT
jgi:uncharacterized damage-inducible protein DinB